MTEFYSTYIDDEIQYVRLSERPTADDICHILDEISGQNAISRRLWILEKGWNLGTRDVQKVADYAKSKARSPVKLAVVLTEQVSYGVTRMFQVYRADEFIDQQIFDTVEKAVAWLKG